MSVAAVASSLSAINTLSTMLFKRDRVDEEYATYGAGFHVINHTDYDFELVETTGDLWSTKTFRKDADTHWIEPPENKLSARHVIACGFEDRYDRDDEVNLMSCLMYYSKTSPVKDLGMLLILWLDIYRDDGEDDPVEFRAGAFSLFCESVRSIGIVESDRKKRLKALTSLYERKKNLLLDRKLNFEWPILNTFAYSEGTNVKSRGFLEGNAARPPVEPNPENYAIQIAVTAGKNAAFGVTLEKLKSPLGDDR